MLMCECVRIFMNTPNNNEYLSNVDVNNVSEWSQYSF